MIIVASWSRILDPTGPGDNYLDDKQSQSPLQKDSHKPQKPRSQRSLNQLKMHSKAERGVPEESQGTAGGMDRPSY